MGANRLNKLVQLSCAAGLNPYQLWCTARHLPAFIRQAREYGRTATGSFAMASSELVPVLVDYDGPAGEAHGHYFHQDLWAARLIEARRPDHHVDIGSRIDGFVAHVLTFMPVTAIDIRPLTSKVRGLTFQQGDATNLHGIADTSIASLSSLHAVEHIGLGRYRDTIDPDGWRKAIHEMTRILRTDGRLYFSVPIGRERVRFNADRIFRPATILDAFTALRLVSFAAVDDRGDFHPAAEPGAFDASENACGLFEFTRD